MTDQQHPITPPPKLFRQWAGLPRSLAFEAAYRDGADAELEACCEWLNDNGYNNTPRALRAARRPKPPSLKEQALAVIENSAICDHLSPEHSAILRRAVEQLDD